MQVFVIVNNVGIKINADVNVNNWLTKKYVINNLFGILVIVSVNAINHDVGEYLDYANCKCRKMLIDKLVEECTENIDEVKIAKITLMESIEIENKCKCSCTIYVVLIVIVFTIYIGIGTYFSYYKYMNHDNKTASKFDYVFQASNY